MIKLDGSGVPITPLENNGKAPPLLALVKFTPKNELQIHEANSFSVCGRREKLEH